MPKNWVVRKAIGKKKYREVYLAYIDILGFRNFLRKNGKDSPSLLVDLFCTIDEEVYPPIQTGLQRRYLSDSIIMWSESTASLPYLFEICQRLQSRMLRHGCLVRGAIVAGKHYSEFIAEWDLLSGKKGLGRDEIMVSPALVRAVELEQKIKRPTIVIEGKVFNSYRLLFQSKGSCLAKRNKNNLYVLDGYYSEFIYLNMLGKHEIATIPKIDILSELKDLKLIKSVVSKNLRKKDAKVLKKWKFIKRLHNRQVKFYEKKLKSSNYGLSVTGLLL